jgi:hypothetical protein
MRPTVRSLTPAWAILIGAVLIAGTISLAASLLTQRLHPPFQFLLSEHGRVVVTDVRTGTAWVCYPRELGAAYEPSDCQQPPSR